MKTEENGQHPLVSERPRGFNGIPEPGDLIDPDVTVAASHMEDQFRTTMTSDDRTAARNHIGYAGWIAGTAVVGGTIAAIVGLTRERRARSRERESACYEPSLETKPHGDKLLPHGQHHW